MPKKLSGVAEGVGIVNEIDQCTIALPLGKTIWSGLPPSGQVYSIQFQDCSYQNQQSVDTFVIFSVV